MSSLSTACALRLPPELKAAVARVVSNEIHSDAHEPGVQAGVAPKAFPISVGLQEAVLSQSLSDIRVLHRRKKKPKHARPVLLDDLVEVLDFH